MRNASGLPWKNQHPKFNWNIWCCHMLNCVIQVGSGQLGVLSPGSIPFALYISSSNNMIFGKEMLCVNTQQIQVFHWVCESIMRYMALRKNNSTFYKQGLHLKKIDSDKSRTYSTIIHNPICCSKHIAYIVNLKY